MRAPSEAPLERGYEVQAMLELIPQGSMWAFGVAGVYASAAAPVVLAATRPMRPPRGSLWDVPRVAQIYTTVVGALSGFTAASAVFVARLGIDHPGEGFETTMGLFTLAFLILAGSAMEFGNTPNAVRTDEGFLRTQRLCFLLANVTLTQGICTGWLALRALLAFAGLDALMDGSAILLLLIVLVAAVRIGQYMYDFSAVCGALCALTPLAAAGVAGAYYLGLAPLVPALAPGASTPLYFAFAGALVALTGFGVQLMLFFLHSQGWLEGAVSRVAEHVVVVHAQVTATAIVLLALSIVVG
jgi:hypothetical protein